MIVGAAIFFPQYTSIPYVYLKKIKHKSEKQIQREEKDDEKCFEHTRK